MPPTHPPRSPGQKEALRLLLKSILGASIGGARAMERHIINAGATDALREQRMNAVCAELLCFHLWRSFRFARQVLPPEAYKPFAATATQGLAVAAAGIFTGLYDKAAQQRFLTNLQATFSRYDRCSPQTLTCRDPLTSTCPIGTLSRALAGIAGRPHEDGVILQSFVVAEQSLHTANTDALVAAFAKIH